MKKLVSLLLVLCMVCAAFPVVAELDATAEYKQTVRIGNATFQVGSDLVCVRNNDNLWMMFPRRK